MFHVRPRVRPSDPLTFLVYELLDAHGDTAQLAADLAVDERWEAHLGYLRDLQRVGREAMAHAGPCGAEIPSARSTSGLPRCVRDRGRPRRSSFSIAGLRSGR
jgi:hypothetical protein